MKSSLIARIAAALSVLAVTAIAAPVFADVYYLDMSPGGVALEPTGPLTNLGPYMYKVTAYSFGPAHPIGSQTGGVGAGKTTATAEASLAVTGLDLTAAEMLFKDAIKGTILPQVTFVANRTIGGKVEPYLLIMMNDVYVTSPKIVGNANPGGPPIDNFFLNYRSVKYEQSNVGDPGTPAGTVQLNAIKWSPANRPAP